MGFIGLAFFYNVAYEELKHNTFFAASRLTSIIAVSVCITYMIA
jgi:hypothetical protein